MCINYVKFIRDYNIEGNRQTSEYILKIYVVCHYTNIFLNEWNTNCIS